MALPELTAAERARGHNFHVSLAAFVMVGRELVTEYRTAPRGAKLGYPLELPLDDLVEALSRWERLQGALRLPTTTVVCDWWRSDEAQAQKSPDAAAFHLRHGGCLRHCDAWICATCGSHEFDGGELGNDDVICDGCGRMVTVPPEQCAPKKEA